MRVLGIDPGLRFTGFACVEAVPIAGRARKSTSGHGSSVRLVDAGVITLKPKLSVAQRLVELDHDLTDIIRELQPDLASVEKLYAHYKHPTTAIIMGHARGIVLLNIQRAGIKLVELGATEVKKSLTGHGHASKEQMQRGVQIQLDLDAPPKPADIADAIAIALCALRRQP